MNKIIFATSWAGGAGDGSIAHLESVIVVRVDPEVGEEAVNHQVHVLLQEGDSARERLVHLGKGNRKAIDHFFSSLRN